MDVKTCVLYAYSKVDNVPSISVAITVFKKVADVKSYKLAWEYLNTFMTHVQLRYCSRSS